ncbi:MAG: flagellar hook-length control protein FliK [Bdellovibrionaceae bacterium]|nr:flagellar hook-length control protein FliK [Pseudobdellovibrionaceae bacterium]
MALLKPQDLDKVPEETASIVVENLDLSEDDEARAQAMYASLLVDLQRIDRVEQPPEFIAQSPAATTPFMQERLQSTQMKRDAMNRSVDLLNKNFWKTAPSETASEALDPMASQAFSSERWAMEDGADLTGMSLAEDLMEGLPPEAAQKVADALSAAEKAPTPENMQRLMDEMKAVAEQRETKSPPETMALGAKLTEQGSEAKVSKEALVRTEASAPSAPSMPMAKMASAEKFGQESGKEDRSSSDGNSSKEVVKPLTGQLAPLKMEDVAAALKASAPVAAPAAAAAMSMTPADNEANVRQLMNQAQYLIKKGGGEVKVEMTPEGMGKIQMKVLLQDGKVNVQMSTETHEAKKAIESSLSELRSSLAAQKLSVDHVKIDVVNGPNTDSQARNDTNMNQQGRDTRQFWNQFQEQFGNRGAREGMWDAPNLKGYRQFKSPQPLEPLETKVASMSRSDGKGRGIDLVA